MEKKSWLSLKKEKKIEWGDRCDYKGLSRVADKPDQFSWMPDLCGSAIFSWIKPLSILSSACSHQ